MVSTGVERVAGPAGSTGALVRAAHVGPCVVVTGVVVLLAVADRQTPALTAIVSGAVFAGQLTIGWGNDLVDAARDREVGRKDKPLAHGALSPAIVLGALATAAVACVTLSFLAGWRSAVVHLLLGVSMGHAYNLVAKRTALSWVPYAIAFGSLPAVVTLAGSTPHWPPAWMPVTAVTLGVAAHFLNTLPDLADDRATGVRGLPHRLGARRARQAATGLLLLGSIVAVLGPGGPPSTPALVVLTAAGVLAVAALAGRGRLPFQAAMAIAVLDVSLLTLVRR